MVPAGISERRKNHCSLCPFFFSSLPASSDLDFRVHDAHAFWELYRMSGILETTPSRMQQALHVMHGIDSNWSKAANS